MDNKSTISRRAILLSARMRFLPETQPIRDTAIDRFIEYCLLNIASENSISARELEKLFKATVPNAANSISQKDVHLSLERLVLNKRVETVGVKKKKRYSLSENSRKNLVKLQTDTDTKLKEVCDKLFKKSQQSSGMYKAPFMECLSYVFSQLGETYVHQMLGNTIPKKLLESPSILTSIQRVLKKYRTLDTKAFTSGVLKFFEEVHPDFNVIKWNLAQNYYIAFTLGLDGKLGLLSHEAFGNASFYLDTNVLIHALEPAARYHGSFQTLTRACGSLKTQICVCQITLDELRNVVANLKTTIPQITEQVPKETALKIRGVFYQLYSEELKETGEVDIDKLFAAFDSPRETLASVHGVQLVDDRWFVNVVESEDVKHQIEAIQKECQRRRDRKKGSATALHDALLTEWIKKERSSTSRDVWIVTLDRSLPLLPRMNQNEKPLAITLDALLQWISPVAMTDEDEDVVSQVFAEAVKYQLLPSESQFEVRDFEFLLATQWQCKNLPAEDVEACIMYLKVNASDLDPHNAYDLQKIAREISRFMADPSRKYKGDVRKLQEAFTTKSREVESRDDEIRELQEKLKAKDDEKAHLILYHSARIRLIWVALISLPLLVASFWLAGNYGDGANWWQRVGDLFWVPTLALAICTALGWFILGKERLLSLGFALKKIFKAD